MYIKYITYVFVCLLVFYACKPAEESSSQTKAEQKPEIVETPFDSAAYQWEGDHILVNWKDLLDVTFVRQPHELLDSADIPQFNEKVKGLHGKKVIIEGFYIPVEETGDENIVILSAYPYAQCFFCGQAGVESIVDILIKEKLPPIKTDTKVRFSGKFKTNADDFDFLIYILEDAKYIK